MVSLPGIKRLHGQMFVEMYRSRGFCRDTAVDALQSCAAAAAQDRIPTEAVGTMINQ